MAKDLLTILKEVRGTGAPEAEYTDGIYHDLTLKTTEDDGVTSRLGSGIYGSIQTMYSVVGVLVDMSDELAVLGGMTNEKNTIHMYGVFHGRNSYCHFRICEKGWTDSGGQKLSQGCLPRNLPSGTGSHIYLSTI